MDIFGSIPTKYKRSYYRRTVTKYKGEPIKEPYDIILLSVLGARGTICYKDKINLCYQFYIDKKEERQKEIRKCLAQNVSNPWIDKIYLFNEQIYSDEELGVKSDKIIQKNIHKRLCYKDFFDCIDNYKIEGYIVLCNADIFFDNTLQNIFLTDLFRGPLMLCQLRFEYISSESHHKLMGHATDDTGEPTHAFYSSSDAWIYHSKFNVPIEEREKFDFQLGVPACDLHFAFLMNTLRYTLIRDPFYIRIFHYHQSNLRNYDKNTQCIKGNQVFIIPYKCSLDKASKGVKLSPFSKTYSIKCLKD